MPKGIRAKKERGNIVSQVVARLIRQRGLGPNDIEHKTDGRLSHSYLSHLLATKDANPKLDKLIDLAEFFGVSIGELVGETRPEGFTENRMWALFRAYTRIEKDVHRKMIEGHLADLMDIIEALPKKARTANAP